VSLSDDARQSHPGPHAIIGIEVRRQRAMQIRLSRGLDECRATGARPVEEFLARFPEVGLRATLDADRKQPATFACTLVPRKAPGAPRTGCGA
jgi:hypothetical protein